MTRNLEGKTALITGAGSGIGRSTALRFAEEGANVVVVNRSESRLHDVADEIGRDHALPIVADVRNSQQLKHAFDAAVEHFGELNVVFNNAGGGEPGRRPIKDFDEALWDDYIALNLSSVFLGMKHGIPLLEAAGGRSIISTSSIGSIGRIAGSGGYSAAKAGILGLTRVAAAETADKGIRVNSIVPGSTVTRLMLPSDPEQEASAIADRRERCQPLTHGTRGRSGGDRPGCAVSRLRSLQLHHRPEHRRRRRHDGSQRVVLLMAIELRTSQGMGGTPDLVECDLTLRRLSRPRRRSSRRLLGS